jgi:hypothetical protein
LSGIFVQPTSLATELYCLSNSFFYDSTSQNYHFQVSASTPIAHKTKTDELSTILMAPLRANGLLGRIIKDKDKIWDC